jgi:ribosomal protein L11 methyltransferase
MPRNFMTTTDTYLWRKRASRRWWRDHGELLELQFGTNLAVIERPDRKQLEIEIAAQSAGELRRIAKRLGGEVRKLSHDWLRHALRPKKTKPLKIGDKKLSIPAGTAFGTGEHATTAMCLRLLERAMRAGRDGSLSRPSNLSDASEKRPYLLVVDLGTGSGILAFAARLLGAKRVIAIDNDPIAIRTAKENARANNIDNVRFHVADVRQWRLPWEAEVVTANLFSELLIEILPKLKRIRRLILSGILRSQEKELIRALQRNRIAVAKTVRRGKWAALLATN